MKKRLLTLVAVIICLSMVFTACGSKAAPVESSAPVASSPAASTEPTPEPVKGLKGNLVYWSMWNENEIQAQIMKEAAAELQAANPDVKITFQWNGRDNSKLMKTALDAGQEIDLFDANNESLGAFTDYLLKLDDYFLKTYPATNGKTLKEALLPAFYKSVQDRSPDKTSVYAFPYQPFIYAVYYNKALFEKAGIAATPKTWTEFTAVCEKLKAAGITPITVDDAYMNISRILHFSRYLGTEGVAKLVLDTTGAEWDNPTVLKLAKDYEDLNKNGYFSKQVVTNKFPAGQMEFANGQAAIYLTNGSWFPSEIINIAGPEFKFGQFAYPAVDGGVMGVEAAMYGAQYLAVTKTSKNPEIAVTFAASMITGKFDEKLSKESNGIAMGTESQWPAAIADSKDVFAAVTANLVNDGGFASQGAADKPQIVHSNWVKLITGKITAEQFVKNCKENKP